VILLVAFCLDRYEASSYAEFFQLDIINMQEKYAITKQLTIVPYRPKYWNLCKNGWSGTLSAEVGQGVPTLFTCA
jgi:hypothetical protein